MAGDSRSSRVGFSARPPAPAWPTLHPGFARPLSPPRSSPKAPPILPPWLGAPPTSPSARGSSYPPPALLLFLSPSISLWKALGTQRRLLENSPKALLECALGGGAAGESTPRSSRSLAPPLPGCAWHRMDISPSAVCAKRCQAKSGQLEGLLGTGRGRTGLARATASVATNIYATSHTRSRCGSQKGSGYWRA